VPDFDVVLTFDELDVSSSKGFLKEKKKSVKATSETERKYSGLAISIPTPIRPFVVAL
jgi:hypothetical protein